MREINDTHALFNSFYHHVNTNANGDPDRIDFAFRYYGKFLDMGVGKGVTLLNKEHLKAIGLNHRREQVWYSQIFFAQVQRLKEILAEKYAAKASLAIMTNLETFDLDGNKTTKSRSSKSSSGSKSARDYDRVRGR